MQNDEQMKLDLLDEEINAELNSSAAESISAADGAEAAAGVDKETRAARKPYRITEFDSPRDKEMAVFTHAKKLSEYIFVITEKSPKKLRWSIVSRLQNTSVEIIENLYRANFEREEETRLAYQKSAAVGLKLLDFYTETARKKQAITVRQTAIIAAQLSEIDKLLSGWVRSTKKK